MDRVDTAILGAWLRLGTWGVEGIDPRLQPAQIARRLGKSNSTVTRRLTAWHASGFLTSVDAIPHPAAFDGEAYFQLVAFDDLSQAEAFRADLELFEGVCSAYRVGTGFGLISIFTSRGSIERDRARTERARGSHAITEHLPVTLPPLKYSMRRRDWELLAKLRSKPRRSIRACGSDLGLTNRSWLNRLSRWVEGNAVFFVPSFDFARSPGTVVWVGAVVEPDQLDGVTRQLSRFWPGYLPVQPVYPVSAMIPDSIAPQSARSVQILAPALTAHAAQAKFLEFSKAPGILRALLSFPGENWEPRQGVDALIAGKLSVGKPRRKAGGIVRIRRAKSKSSELGIQLSPQISFVATKRIAGGKAERR